MFRSLLERFFPGAPPVVPLRVAPPATFADALALRAQEWTAEVNALPSSFSLVPVRWTPSLPEDVHAVCHSIWFGCAKESDAFVLMPARNKMLIDVCFAFVLFLFLIGPLRDEGHELDADDFIARFILPFTWIPGVDTPAAAEAVVSARRAAVDIVVQFADAAHPSYDDYACWHDATIGATMQYVWSGEKRWRTMLTPLYEIFAHRFFAMYLVKRTLDGDPVSGWVSRAAPASAST